MRSSTWSRINNRISPRVGDGAGCHKEAITEEGEIEVEAASEVAPDVEGEEAEEARGVQPLT
jgi:hypothetical protein